MQLALRTSIAPDDWAHAGARAIYTAIDILRRQDDEADRVEKESRRKSSR